MVWILKIMAKILEQELWGLCVCVFICVYTGVKEVEYYQKLIHKRALFNLLKGN